MQVYECREITMQRDMDLVRDLLLRLEADPLLDGTRWICLEPSELGFGGRSAEEVGYHLTLLIEAGFIDGQVGIESLPILRRLTWQGHEFLDSIRDPDIWAKTKERTKGLTSVGLAFIWEIAKAEIRTKLGLS